MIDFLSQRAHLVLVKHEEMRRPADASQTIIDACDAALRALTLRDTVPLYIEMTQVKEEQQ